MCVHVFICVDKTLRFNENPCEGWGHLLINILIRHWLAEQEMLVFVCVCVCVFGVMASPSLSLMYGFLSFRQTEESYQSIPVGSAKLPPSVLVKQD